jgi:hypothetical protein
MCDDPLLRDREGGSVEGGERAEEKEEEESRSLCHYLMPPIPEKSSMILWPPSSILHNFTSKPSAGPLPRLGKRWQEYAVASEPPLLYPIQCFLCVVCVGLIAGEHHEENPLED